MSEVTERRVHAFQKKVSLQLSSEQSVGDVWIAQLDRKRIPQATSSGWKGSVAVTVECSRHHGGRNLS